LGAGPPQAALFLALMLSKQLEWLEWDARKPTAASVG